MKKALKVSVVLATIGAFFIGGNASASTIYQQLIDSSQTITGTHCCTNIGSFTISATSTISNASYAYGPFNVTALTTYPYNNVIIYIEDKNSSTIATYIAYGLTTSTGSQFLQLNYLSGSTIVPGTYTLQLDTESNSNTISVNADTNGNWFGYIVNNGATSVPIIPNTPGFSDVGVSTSTVYANCYANLSNATSSSYFSQVEQDISLGMCQTATLLFIPNPTTLSNFNEILPNLGTKFPFSWFIAVPITWNTLSATNTNALPSFSVGLHALGIGSTTPMGNILPDFVILSTTTISTYLSDGERETIVNLIAVGLWLSLIAEVWFTVKHKTFTSS